MNAFTIIQSICLAVSVVALILCIYWTGETKKHIKAAEKSFERIRVSRARMDVFITETQLREKQWREYKASISALKAKVEAFEIGRAHV